VLCYFFLDTWRIWKIVVSFPNIGRFSCCLSGLISFSLCCGIRKNCVVWLCSVCRVLFFCASLFCFMFHGYWIVYFAFIGQSVLKCAFDWWCCGILLESVKFLSSSSLSCWEADVGVSIYTWGSVHSSLQCCQVLLYVFWDSVVWCVCVGNYNVFLEAWPFFITC
jgi:hypothetical protein